MRRLKISDCSVSDVEMRMSVVELHHRCFLGRVNYDPKEEFEAGMNPCKLA